MMRKVAIVHNAYGRISGEEVVIDNLAALPVHNFYGYSYRFQFRHRYWRIVVLHSYQFQP